MKSILYFIRQHRTLGLSLAIAWTVFIFIGCSLPGKDLPELGLFNHFDKFIHFFFFLLFFILWSLYSLKSKANLLIIFFISVLFGFALEYYQLVFVAGRSFDVWDGIADAIGAGSGWIIMRTK